MNYTVVRYLLNCICADIDLGHEKMAVFVLATLAPSILTFATCTAQNCHQMTTYIENTIIVLTKKVKSLTQFKPYINFRMLVHTT